MFFDFDLFFEIIIVMKHEFLLYFKILVAASRCCARMVWYLALSMIVFILTIASVSAEEKQPYRMILTQPCFIVS